MTIEIPTFILDDDSIDALYDAFENIVCSNLEPDFDSFDTLSLPTGVAPSSDTEEIAYVIIDVRLDTVEGVRGIWATMRPYMWDPEMVKTGEANGSLNAKPRFRLAVIEGNVTQSVLFARKKLHGILEDTILTWEVVGD